MGVLDRFRLDDRVAIVTGGSRGFGEAIARGLAEAGASVAITSRHLDECTTTANQLAADTGATFLPLEADVCSEDEIDAMRDAVLERFGRIDILVNNAGVGSRSDLLDIETETWQRVLDIDLTGPMLCMRSVMPTMLEADYGRIINIGSTLAMVGFGGRAAYCAAKAGLINLTRDVALEFAKTGVRVNAICPGTFETTLTQPIKQNPEEFARFTASIPMGRWGQPDEELAPAAVFLASEAASLITGIALMVDADWTAK